MKLTLKIIFLIAAVLQVPLAYVLFLTSSECGRMWREGLKGQPLPWLTTMATNWGAFVPTLFFILFLVGLVLVDKCKKHSRLVVYLSTLFILEIAFTVLMALAYILPSCGIMYSISK